MEEQNEQRESILPGQEICLGRQGENLVRELRFDLSDFLESYPNGRITLVAQRNGEDLPYPVIHTRQSDRQLIWTPSDADTGKCGYGRCELRCYDGDRLAKSNVWTTFTLPALGMPGTLPDAAEDYITAMQRIGDAVNQAQKQAPKIGQNGNWWIYDAVTECYLDSGYPARGAQGPQGVQGEPGHVPLDVTLTQAGQAADAKKTGDEIGGLKSIINRRRIVNSVNGDYPILTIPDGADGGAVKKLTVSIAPIQSGSGTPSAENVRPISGWTGAEVTRTGKNLIDAANYEIPDNSSSSNVVWQGSLTGAFILSADISKVTSVAYPDARFVSVRVNGNTAFYTYNQLLAGIAVSGTVTKITAYGSLAYARVTGIISFQLELGSTATDYEPYQGETITIDLDGTCYGGSLDVKNGVMTVDRAMVDLGTLSWIAAYGGFATAPSKIAPWSSNAQAPTTLICSAYPVMPYSGATDKSLSRIANTSYVRIKDSSYSTPSDFYTAMSGVQLVYELATPFTVQLTPKQISTLYGSNNIWADCGSIKSANYDADTKLYIDNRIAQALNA